MVPPKVMIITTQVARRIFNVTLCRTNPIMELLPFPSSAADVARVALAMSDSLRRGAKATRRIQHKDPGFIDLRNPFDQTGARGIPETARVFQRFPDDRYLTLLFASGSHVIIKRITTRIHDTTYWAPGKL